MSDVNELLSAKYLYALELVAKLFNDHKRAGSDTPYVTHLVAVCHIVEQLTDDENVHLAALLHDVLEDIPADQYGAKELEADFGTEVLRIVQTVSHDDARYGKDEARRRYIRQLQAGTLAACLVSGADMLHNGTDIIRCYKRDHEKATRYFGGERAKRRAWFWHERFDIIQQKLVSDHLLVLNLQDMFKRLDPIHQEMI